MIARVKPAEIPRAGYEYQDLVGIEVLIRHYRDPRLYAWVLLEADDTEYHALDDVVAARKDGSYEFVQVKFTVDSERYELDWDWLLAKKKRGTSMLEKWATSVARIGAMGPIHSATLKTNRTPSAEFAKCLKGTRVALDLLPKDIRQSVETECGGVDEAEAFFRIFDFNGGLPDLDEYETSLRDQVVPTDTDSSGWLALRHYVRRWAIYRNQPEPDGRILREHVVQLVTKRRPQPIRQDFLVPDGYVPPSEAFHYFVRDRITKDDHPITVLWGTPGRGKSTYLSYLTQALQEEGAAVVRHHYFLSAEDSSANRASFVEIATSLIGQLSIRHPDAMDGVQQGAEMLRAVVEGVARNLAAKKQRLYIIVDGLDHVWRDTQRVDQLNHLFNEILPLPANVSLVVGTQRVPDEHLPGKLITITQGDDWIEIPSMDEVAVHQWVVQQDEARPLVLRFRPPPERRAEQIGEIAGAFFKISHGHPLHLIYAYEELVRAGRPISAEDVERLPPCPDGDIRSYYKGLWIRLSADAKSILHALAGSNFFWPSLGIRQVLGEISEIDFLLEPRNAGMVPFHQSIFAWVRERTDHSENYRVLLPKIIAWLEKDAPEYWSWGWLWLAKAQVGEFDSLLSGATRDWVVESFAKGWPDQQIENILAVAEEKSFEDGDLPRTISLRSLKTRASNAREYQTRDFARYRATALAISNNRQQILNLLDEIRDLTDSEVTQIARLAPADLSSQVIAACMEELARRVNAWVVLRHRPGQEFTSLSDHLLSVGAMMGPETVRRVLKYVRGFKEPGRHVFKFIRLLGNAHNVDGLRLIYKTLRAGKWREQRRQAYDEILRIACFDAADARQLLPNPKEPISVFAACFYMRREPNENLQVFIPSLPKDLIRERYSYGENEDVSSFFYAEFWNALYTGLRAGDAPYMTVRPDLGEEDPGWLMIGIGKLQQIAGGIASGQLAASFSTVYAELEDIKPIYEGRAAEKETAQYRAFSEAARRIAVDLHFFGLPRGGNTRVSLSELSVARKSPHWSDQIWLSHNTSNRIRLLDKAGAAALLTEQSKALLTNVTEFSERGEQWVELADFAHLYDDGRQSEFLLHAAECLIGYGWRKDLHAMDVLDAVMQTSKVDPERTDQRLVSLVPIVDVITEFTDGDETNYVRSELIECVAKIAPKRLTSLYEHHLLTDEYSYADECLVELAKAMSLDTNAGAALARTFLDDRPLAVLEERAAREVAARALLDGQNSFLGRVPRAGSRAEESKEEPSEWEREAAKVDPTSFGSKKFSAVVKAADAIHYADCREFMNRWLRHWEGRGQALRALASIRSFFDENQATFGADEILDEAFLVSLRSQGKEAAYAWLVQAHIRRNGWQSYYTSEAEVMTRIELVALHYRDRWRQYIKDTSVPIFVYKRRRSSFVLGFKYLVRFLMLVGQDACADKVTTALVNSLVDEVREQPIPEASWFQ